MSKSEKSFSRQGTRAQGESSIEFIQSCIIIALAGMLYHAQTLNFNTAQGRGQSSSSSSKNLSGVPTLASDRTITPAINRTGFSYFSPGPADADRSSAGAFLATVFTENTENIINKLWQIESGRRLNPPDGDGGDAVGPLQLHLDVLKDVNRYFDADFAAADRKDLAKSKQIAKLYIQMWLQKNAEEIAVRIFNGCPRGFKSDLTDNYWNNYKNLKLKN